MHIKTCQAQFGLFSSALVKRHNLRPGGGMVDTRDLKSLASNGVRVRVPPRVFVVSQKDLTFGLFTDFRLIGACASIGWEGHKFSSVGMLHLGIRMPVW